MNSAIKWHLCRKVVVAFAFSLVGLGLAAPAQAQDGTSTVPPMNCAQFNDFASGKKFAFGPGGTLESSTGDSVYVGLNGALTVAVGDIFTFALSEGLQGVETPPPSGLVATDIQWHLAAYNPALVQDSSRFATDDHRSRWWGNWQHLDLHAFRGR